jgi:hypothetical protein
VETKVRYRTGKTEQSLGGVVDRTLRQLGDLQEKIQGAALDPAILEECAGELESLTAQLSSSIQEAMDVRRILL